MTTPRRIYYDLEFLEDGRSIELISIGMVDDQGREYYAVNRNALWHRIANEPWLMENVIPSLPRAFDGAGRPRSETCCGIDFDHPDVKPIARIADEVRAFIVRDPDQPVELWAWYGAFDHVRLAWLWGRMIDLPAGVPMFTHDLRQWQSQLGSPWLPKQPSALTAHNALDDARFNRIRWTLLNAMAAGRLPTDLRPASAER